MDKFSVLICSCDKYQDVWSPMFRLFFKYWADCPCSVYLMTNLADFQDDRVVTLKTGEDVSWSAGFRKALKLIDTEYVLILMEDYLLKKPVRNADIEAALRYMSAERLDCLRIFPCPEPDEPYGAVGEFQIGLVHPEAPYRISLQAAIWSRAYVLSVIDDRDSAWQFEYCGSQRSSRDGSKIAGVYKSNDRLIFDYFCTGVIQGYWVKEAVALCKREGIEPDLKKRPIEPFWIREKRVTKDRYLGGIRRFLKKTALYGRYRAKKYG